MSTTPNPLFVIHILNDQGHGNISLVGRAFEQMFDMLQRMIPGDAGNVARAQLVQTWWAARQGLESQPENQQQGG